MVLISCRATARRRRVFQTVAVCAFSGSMVSISCLIMLEIYTYIILDRVNIMTMLDAYMPIINRKALGVGVMGCIVLFIQMMSINIMRGQEVVRLRASLKNSTEKILTMSLAIVILLFLGALCLVYANVLKSSIARGLLKTIADYDEKADARAFIDNIQNAYNCCGINSAEDYQDLSAVDLYGIKNPLPRDKTLHDCPHEDVACLYPLSCCFSVECTEYRLADFNTEGDRFHNRWYKNKGCVPALLSSHFGLRVPKLSTFLVSLSFSFEVLALLFAQLTLTGYMTLAESGLSDVDESIAWVLPFSYPEPEDLVEHLSDWAAQIYLHKDEMEQEESEIGQKESVKTNCATNATDAQRTPATGDRMFTRKRNAK